jgi:hypothetical protein
LTEHPIGIRLAVKKTAGKESIGDINERRREHMKTLLGGALAAAIGLILLVIWWEEFFEVLAGIIPVMLFLGGGLAIYLGFDELKDSWKEEESFDTEESTGGNVEKYKQEIDGLKEEIETLKKEKDGEEEKKEEKEDKAQKAQEEEK